MNNIVISILKENGWYPDRIVNISLILQNWNNHKYIISKNQIKFIENIGNLKIEFINCKNKRYIIEIFPNDWNFLPEILKTYEDYFGKKLIPIGEVCYQNIQLLIDKDIKIYGVFDEYGTLLGNNFFEFIENLYDNKKIIWDIIESFYD